MYHIESGDDETNGNNEPKEPPAPQQKVHNILYVHMYVRVCMHVCMAVYISIDNSV